MISEAKNIDCMEYLNSFNLPFIDVIFTSPPYNLGKNHHTGNKKHNPYNDDLPEGVYQNNQLNLFSKLYQLSNTGASFFYNHKNRIKGGKQISPYEWILKSEWTIKQEIVWVNGSQNFDKCRFYPFTERIYWLSKGEKTAFNNNSGLSDVNNWIAEGTNKKHTRAFPLKMATDILNCFEPYSNVCDPYLGSGTTRIASDIIGHNFFGSEISKDYFDAQEKRFAKHIAQTKLFTPQQLVAEQTKLL